MFRRQPGDIELALEQRAPILGNQPAGQGLAGDNLLLAIQDKAPAPGAELPEMPAFGPDLKHVAPVDGGRRGLASGHPRSHRGGRACRHDSGLPGLDKADQEQDRQEQTEEAGREHREKRGAGPPLAESFQDFRPGLGCAGGGRVGRCARFGAAGPRSRGRGIGRSRPGAKAGPLHSRGGVGRLGGPEPSQCRIRHGIGARGRAERGAPSGDGGIGAWARLEPGDPSCHGGIGCRAGFGSWRNRIRGGGTQGDALGAGARGAAQPDGQDDEPPPAADRDAIRRHLFIKPGFIMPSLQLSLARFTPWCHPLRRRGVPLSG